MKASKNIQAALADIEQVTTSGHVRRIGSEMLLALARKEIPAADVEAGAKMLAAISLNMQSETRLALAALTLREKNLEFTRVEHFGQTVIGST